MTYVYFIGKSLQMFLQLFEVLPGDRMILSKSKSEGTKGCHQHELFG